MFDALDTQTNKTAVFNKQNLIKLKKVQVSSYVSIYIPVFTLLHLHKS